MFIQWFLAVLCEYVDSAWLSWWRVNLAFRVSSQNLLLGTRILPVELVTVIWEDLLRLKIGSERMGCRAVDIHGYDMIIYDILYMCLIVWEITASKLLSNVYRFLIAGTHFLPGGAAGKRSKQLQGLFYLRYSGMVIQWLKKSPTFEKVGVHTSLWLYPKMEQKTTTIGLSHHVLLQMLVFVSSSSSDLPVMLKFQ